MPNTTQSKGVASVSLVLQQTGADCAVAGVAMLLGRSYAEVFQANEELSRSVRKVGASDAAIRKLVRALGASLTKTLKVDLDDDTGLLALKSSDIEKQAHHLVVLFRGVLVDPGTCLLWDPEVYLQTHSHLSVWYLLELT